MTNTIAFKKALAEMKESQPDLASAIGEYLDSIQHWQNISVSGVNHGASSRKVPKEKRIFKTGDNCWLAFVNYWGAVFFEVSIASQHDRVASPLHTCTKPTY